MGLLEAQVYMTRAELAERLRPKLGVLSLPAAALLLAAHKTRDSGARTLRTVQREMSRQITSLYQRSILGRRGSYHYNNHHGTTSMSMSMAVRDAMREARESRASGSGVGPGGIGAPAAAAPGAVYAAGAGLGAGGSHALGGGALGVAGASVSGLSTPPTMPESIAEEEEVDLDLHEHGIADSTGPGSTISGLDSLPPSSQPLHRID